MRANMAMHLTALRAAGDRLSVRLQDGKMMELHWTQILSALLTPTIAVLGSVIAYRQWKTAQNKLKLDLFEKRFAVYDSARKLLSSIMTSGKAKDEEMYKFLYGTREAKWLLNDDIAKYLDEELWKMAVELQTLDAEVRRHASWRGKVKKCPSSIRD